MKKTNLKAIAGTVSESLRKRSPEILMGVGIAGMITTTVLAVKATPKAVRLIEEQKKIAGVEKLALAETVKAAGSCYIPAAITGTLSVACLIGSSSVNSRRNAALATAYHLSETALKEYRSKVVETIGPKKEQEVRNAILKDRIENDPVQRKEVIVTGTGETLCYDVHSARYFKSDMEKIKKAINALNRQMLSEQYVSLNDFYYELGLPSSQIGEDLGWNIDKGFIDVQFGSHLATDGTPCLAIAYTLAPQYGYNILGLL